MVWSFFNYRLLKDGLGGNSKTFLIATVSPFSENLEETISTLRFASLAKKVETKAVVNEDENSKIIRGIIKLIKELRDQVSQLQAALKSSDTEEIERLKYSLENSQKMMETINLSWEQKLQKIIADIPLPKLIIEKQTYVLSTSWLTIVRSDDGALMKVDQQQENTREIFSVQLSANLSVILKLFMPALVNGVMVEESLLISKDSIIEMDGSIAKIEGFLDNQRCEELENHTSTKQEPPKEDLIAKLEMENQKLQQKLLSIQSCFADSIKITIPRIQLINHVEKPFYLYEIIVECGNLQYSVHRRFKEFHEMHQIVNAILIFR